MHRTPNYSSPPILLSASHSHLNYPHTDSVVHQKGSSVNETTPRHDRRSMHSSSLFFTAPTHSSSLTPKTPLNPYHPHKYSQQPIPLSFSPASPDPQKNDPMDDGDGDESNPSSLSLSTPSHTIRDSSSYLSYSLHNSGTNMLTINLSDDISVICFQRAVEGRGGIGAGPLFAVREFDTKFIRSFAFNDNSQSHAMILSESADSMIEDHAASNRKGFRSLPSEQAMRAAIRQAILNLRLRSEPANKKEIKMLKEANILGKRAPSCSLLNGEDMLRLLRAFGRSDSAKMLRDALRRNIHLFPSGSINESLLDYVCEKEDIPQMNLTDINALGDDEPDGVDEGGGKTEIIEPATVHHQRRGSLPVYILKGRGKHTRLTDNSDSDEDDPRTVKSADKQDRRRSSKSSASAHKRRRNSSFTRSLSSPMLTAALNSLREQALSDNTEHPSNASASSDDDGLGALLFALEASAPSSASTTTPAENQTPKVATIVHRGDRDRDRAVQAVIVAKQTQTPPTINASHPSSLPPHPNSSHPVVAVAVATPVTNNGGTPPKSSVAVAVARPASANVTVALEAIPHARPVANNASNPSLTPAVAIATPVSANNSRGSVTATVATAVAVPATPAVAAIAAVPASRSSQKERRNTHNRAASPVTARPVTIPTPHQQQPTTIVPFKSISAPTTPVHSRPNSPHSAALLESKKHDRPLNGGNGDIDALDTSALRVVVNEIPSRSMVVTKQEEESDSSSRSTTPVSPVTFVSPARDHTTVDAAHTLTSVAAVASESAMVIDVDEKPRVGFLPPLHPSNYHLNNPLSKSVSTLTNLAFRRSSLSALTPSSSSSSSSSPPLPLASLSISAPPRRPSLPLPSSLTSLARHACSTADASRNIQSAFDGG